MREEMRMICAICDREIKVGESYDAIICDGPAKYPYAHDRCAQNLFGWLVSGAMDQMRKEARKRGWEHDNC